MGEVARNLRAQGVPMKADRSSPNGLLRGSDAVSRTIAGAVNRLTAGPGGSGAFRYKGADVALQRGRGSDFSAEANHLLTGEIEATGYIDPPSGRREVGFSGLKIGGDRLAFGFAPTRLRLFNTPSGELRAEFQPRIDVSVPGLPRFRTAPGDQYVIGKAVGR